MSEPKGKLAFAYATIRELEQKIASMRLQTKKVEGEICQWAYEGLDDYWATECGNAHTFITDGPVENKYKFCPYCGKELCVVMEAG